MPRYASQAGQDRFLDRVIFRRKRGGVFVDVGAYDGRHCSNSWFFERHRGWTGVCVEPQPGAFRKLARQRDCACVEAAVAPQVGRAEFQHLTGTAEMFSGLTARYHPRHRELVAGLLEQHGGGRELITVDTTPLGKILAGHGISEIDFCSIDTEGSELQVLQSIDFEAVFIKCFLVENPFGETAVQEFLEHRGYQLVRRLEYDDLYLHKLVQAARLRRISAFRRRLARAAPRAGALALLGLAGGAVALAAGAPAWLWGIAGLLFLLGMAGWSFGAGHRQGVEHGQDLAPHRPS